MRSSWSVGYVRKVLVLDWSPLVFSLFVCNPKSRVTYGTVLNIGSFYETLSIFRSTPFHDTSTVPVLQPSQHQNSCLRSSPNQSGSVASG